MSTMSWSGILDLLISIYADKDDDYVISIGGWEDKKHQLGLIVPAFNAKIGMTVGELKAMQTYDVELLTEPV